MAEPHFPGDDDLPRTFRRERDARAREAAALGAQVQANRDYGPPAQDYGAGAHDSLYAAGFSGTVHRFEVPFLHLVKFFLKSVLAAIPALILLGMLLFGAGKLLQAIFPAYRLFEIKIQPIEAAPAAASPKAPPTTKAAPAAKP